MSSTNTFNMAYLDSSRDVTLVMLHGFPFSSAMWWPQINGLEHLVRVIAPDLRGFGRSRAPVGEYSLRVFAEDTLAMLDSIGINDQIILCGMSMGGYVALEFARRFPKRLSGLILASTRATPDNERDRRNRNATIDTVNEDGVAAMTMGLYGRLFAYPDYDPNNQMVKSLRQMMASSSQMGVVGALGAMRDRIDYRPHLADIELPTLILHGANDRLTNIEEARIMHELLPASNLISLPHAGHLANLEQPEQWNRAVEQFLRTFFV